MAAVVKLGDFAAILGSQDRVDWAFHHSQSCKLQKPSLGWRFTHRLSTNGVELSRGCPCHGNPLPKGTKADPFRVMALPIDRKSVEDGNESAAAQEGKEEQSQAAEPWLGAVIFKRSGHNSHYEFNTSLERLGLRKLSTASSRALANSMGLNAASSAAPATEECTPVNISIDVSRDEDSKDLRLDGIARTTISLCCNRCLLPVVERIFASFNLLLTEKPVLEPTQQRIGVVLGENGPGNDGPQLDLELDDKLHFPREAKEIDLSKYFRDSVHLEIPYKSLCSIQCAGLCFTCGVNLNSRTCDCKDVNVKPSWGPLEQLRKQMKDEEGPQ
ncbi:unnamed protein product [Calypogeia fissa]